MHNVIKVNGGFFPSKQQIGAMTCSSAKPYSGLS